LNSQFYFTSGQTTSTSAALQLNLLTGSTVTSSTGGADVGSPSAVNDLNAVPGTGAIDYYGNTLYGSSLNPGTLLTHGVVTLTIPLGGASPAASGYTLGSINVFEGWTDHASFDDQHYVVTVSMDQTNYNFLREVNYMPFAAAEDAGGGQSASTLVTLTNLNVSGVKSIRFTLYAGYDVYSELQQGELLQEIEVFGAQNNAALPKISAVAKTASGLVFSGSNGPANGTYYVLTATNIALPLASWTRASTNFFDANGNFTITNAINAGVPDQFYQLLVP